MVAPDSRDRIRVFPALRLLERATLRGIERVPGLSDPEAAYETGRALRMIGHILDSQRSPVEHG